MLDAPAARDELGGEPVQQFRVGGRQPRSAKIRRACNDSAPEVAHPELIHEDAGRQWMIRLRQPSCQRQPAAAGFRALIRTLDLIRPESRLEHRGNTRLNGLHGCHRIAPLQQVRDGGLASHVHQHAYVRLRQQLPLRRIQVLLNGIDPAGDLGIFLLQLGARDLEGLRELARQVLLDAGSLVLGCVAERS